MSSFILLPPAPDPAPAGRRSRRALHRLALEQYNAGSTDFIFTSSRPRPRNTSKKTALWRQREHGAASRGLVPARAAAGSPSPSRCPRPPSTPMKSVPDWAASCAIWKASPLPGQSEIPQAETHRGY